MPTRGKLFFPSCGFYRVPPEVLLRVIAESYLDAAGEDADLQRELVEAAVEATRSGRVLGCWLGLEGDGAETEESPDSGNEQDDRLPGEDWTPPRGWVREPEMSSHQRVDWRVPADALAASSRRQLPLAAAAKPPKTQVN